MGSSEEHSPTVNSVLRGVARDTLRQFGFAAALLSAGGYVLGHASIWLFSLGLGIAPSDLGLGNRDYLLMAAVWALLLAAYGVGSVVLIAGTVPYSTNLLISSYIGVAGVTLAAPWPPVAGVALLWAVIVLGALLLIFLRHTVLQVPSTFGRICLILLWIAIPSLMGGTCVWWGRAIRDDPTIAARGGPIALVFVVPANEGRITLDSDSVCAARLSDRVYIAEDGVIVTAGPQRFRPGSCL